MQINLYLLSRITVGLARLAVKSKVIPEPTFRVFPWFGAMTWGIVLWLFEHHRETLQPSLRSSMTYLYHDSNYWTSIRDFLFVNKLWKVIGQYEHDAILKKMDRNWENAHIEFWEKCVGRTKEIIWTYTTTYTTTQMYAYVRIYIRKPDTNVCCTFTCRTYWQLSFRYYWLIGCLIRPHQIACYTGYKEGG